MLSMTGFGLAKVKTRDSEVQVQVKSVNSRYLDVKIHMPREYTVWEKEVRDQLKLSLQRGTVEVYCSRKFNGKTSEVSLQTDEVLAKSWLKEYCKLSKQLGLKSDPKEIKLIEMLKSAPVLSVHEKKGASASEKQVFFKALGMALKSCVAERKREGAALKVVFNSLLSELSKEVLKIEKNRTKANIELQKRWKAKLSRLKDQKGIDPSRLAQEVSLLIEKSDINEEVVRLREHISNCKSLLKSKGRRGKKLEFYTQELLREINTVGSKSQIVELTNSVVNAKTIIEQIREQVQNIE